ncbi:MAG: family 43 glycosylhydrolase [Opitutales bacterium]|nr:family 43 glycosylhydrolase [Opitutales bacterium]
MLPLKYPVLSLLAALCFAVSSQAGNPVIKDRFTADPAALVHDGKVYLYVGHDEATPEDGFFVLNEWLIFSSDNMIDWELKASLPRSEFEWGRRPTAWAAQAIERDGKFFWYVTVLNDDPDPAKAGFGIGVAFANSPTGPFKDALGEPLVRSDMTTPPEFMIEGGRPSWDNIDPTVFIDDDGQAYLYWGNTHLYYSKLKDNMIELDGEIHQVEIEGMPGTFTEAPWLHQHGNTYYLSFAMDYPEKIAYATSDTPVGPWSYGGLILDVLPDTGTSHQAFLEFEGEWYFIHHTAALPGGGNYRRSVAIERFEHNPDGSIDQLVSTASGLAFEPYLIGLFDSDGNFLRHQDRQAVVSSWDAGEAYDFKWHLVDGLEDSVEDGVSIQSENMPGFYLLRSERGGIRLAKHDGSEDFAEAATFAKVRGLSSREATSFMVPGERQNYLLVTETGALMHGRVMRADRYRATFVVRR